MIGGVEEDDVAALAQPCPQTYCTRDALLPLFFRVDDVAYPYPNRDLAVLMPLDGVADVLVNCVEGVTKHGERVGVLLKLPTAER